MSSSRTSFQIILPILLPYVPLALFLPDYRTATGAWYNQSLYPLHKLYHSGKHRNREGISWDVEPADCRGYAVRLQKTLTVSGNTIRIGYHLTNTGSKPINTTDYNHNFVLIDHEPVGSAYRLAFSRPITFKRMDESILTTDGHVTWPDGSLGFYAICHDVPATGTQSWEMWNDKSGAGLRETLDTDVCRIALWGMPHVISPEMFKAIALEPGEHDTWSRTYAFMSRL